MSRKGNHTYNATFLRQHHIGVVFERTDNNHSLMSKAQKDELDKTLAEHKAGKLKYYTLEQAKEILNSN